GLNSVVEDRSGAQGTHCSGRAKAVTVQIPSRDPHIFIYSLMEIKFWGSSGWHFDLIFCAENKNGNMGVVEVVSP
ncbi:hypothetical protein HAX54_017809, partial [Datura stramonium]|nr:hypothetical protein [Datura stramonium]